MIVDDMGEKGGEQGGKRGQAPFVPPDSRPVS